MKHITAMIIALVAIAGIFGTTTIIQTASALTDTEILLQIWHMVNVTSANITLAIYKIDHLNSANFTLLISRLADIKSSLTNVSKRMGYNSTFTIKSDFDKVLASLYTANGSNRIEVINGNQLVLAHISENTFNKLQDTQTSVNQTKASVDASSIKIAGYEFNIQLILILVFTIIFMMTGFIIWYVRSRKGKVQEYRGQNESLFMPPPPPVAPPLQRQYQQPQQTVEDIVDAMPECFRIQYDSRSNDCRSCGVRQECSGQRPVKQNTFVKQPTRSRYVKQ